MHDLIDGFAAPDQRVHQVRVALVLVLHDVVDCIQQVFDEGVVLWAGEQELGRRKQLQRKEF